MGKNKWKMSIVSGILMAMANAVYAGVPSYDMEEIVVTAAAVVNPVGEETINKNM